jgi:hypothetical protein
MGRHLRRPPGAPFPGPSELDLEREVSNMPFDGKIGCLTRDISFAVVCKCLGLDNIVNEDPGISSVLDDLASEHERLQEIKATLSVPEYHSMTARLDWKVWQAITMRLGDLRIAHHNATMLDDAGALIAREEGQNEGSYFDFAEIMNDGFSGFRC